MKWIQNKNWDYLSQQYDWVSDMQGVPQSPVHHAEGDVALHTQMVLQALTGLAAYQELPEAAQDILWMAALLHDVEKRSTTFTDADGDVVSPGHAKKGAVSARHILFTQFDIPFADREQIVHLVRYHGLPLWLMHKPDPRKALLEASLQVNTAWLAMLATADILGRICTDQAAMLDRIAFFEAYCQEQGCWGVPYPFSSDLNRFRYFHTEEGNPDYAPFDDTICTVTVMSGLPGMGKDTYIGQHLQTLPVVSPDALRRQYKLKPDDKAANGRIAQMAKEEARVYLRNKQDFVWNATNITLQMRSQLIALLTDYKARVHLVYVECPYKVWQQQNKAREAMVPAAVLEKMLRKLEVPGIREAHSVQYITS